MTGAVIKILIGLFIGIALPTLLKRRIRTRSMNKFISLACLIIGALIVIYGVVGLVTGVVSV